MTEENYTMQEVEPVKHEGFPPRPWKAKYTKNDETELVVVCPSGTVITVLGTKIDYEVREAYARLIVDAWRLPELLAENEALKAGLAACTESKEHHKSRHATFKQLLGFETQALIEMTSKWGEAEKQRDELLEAAKGVFAFTLVEQTFVGRAKLDALKEAISSAEKRS